MPLIDVIFLLLTFFIYALVLMVRAELLPMELESYAAADAAKPAPAETISIALDGTVYLNRDPIQINGILPALQEAIEANPDAMFPPVRERFRAGKAVSGPDFVAGWQRLETLRAAYAQATAGYDAVLVPSVALLPPKQAEVAADHARFTSENLLTLRNTRIGNLMGLCALTLPTATPSCGLSLMAGPGQEARLLRIGAALAPLLT